MMLPRRPFQPPQRARRSPQAGVALITTLVMLSLVTLMAVVFLAVSRRERASVTVTLDQTAAKMMADTALARAQAQVMGEIFTRSIQTRITNSHVLLAFDFAVSTNYINPLGFVPNSALFHNVNYDYTQGRQPLTDVNQQRQNMANLKFDPRPPVFVLTNAATGAKEFRFYLDFNRNRLFDTNGWLIEFDRFGARHTNFYVGDPEWIGVLERPELPHSGTNRFIGRYAYIILPAGRALDLNFIHNQAKRMGPGNEGFLRNQGVGSWEINLAAFLQDLNTNIWPKAQYTYSTDRVGSPGRAFYDAFVLLTNRYKGTYANLRSVENLFGPRVAQVFRTDAIDEYSDGQLALAAGPPPPDDDRPADPWSGSDNPAGYFDVQDLFNPRTLSPALSNFTQRLQSFSFSPTNYDRYTFYRLMSQLGTDSSPDLAGRININYTNDLTTYGVATNHIDWQPTVFFNTAADRMLRSEFGLAITNIPVWPTNFYTPGVHRTLQVAANVFDATTNRTTLSAYPHFPSVFRPVFRDTGNQVVIVGYREEFNAGFISLNPWRDLSTPVKPTIGPNDNVFGIPAIIGAKKGFPNFNEFAMQTAVQATRKLELRKRFSADRVPNLTNQMYILGISNQFGVEAWNSYRQTYPRELELRATNYFTMLLTNEFNEPLIRQAFALGTVTNIAANTWTGYGTARQFLLPLYTNQIILQDSAYYTRPNRQFRPATTNVAFEQASGYAVPRWGVVITNRLVYVLIDRASQRVVDFVNLGNLVSRMDLTDELMGESYRGADPIGGEFWSTNGLPPLGVVRQLQASLGVLNVSDWRSYSPQSPSGEDKEKAIKRFRAFTGLDRPSDEFPPTNTVMQAPFTPTRKLVRNDTWQANDPLVHYTTPDLMDPVRTNNVQIVVPPDRVSTNSNLGQLNDRYQPWGGRPGKSPASDPNAYNLAVKDPLVRNSDDWAFPAGKFANLGWLGRVHRGTPWQTLYLKSEIIPPNEWRRWAGDFFTHPTNDWALMKHFTVATTRNAASGLLSVNQTNLAAWSAILSGVIVVSNTIPAADVRPDTVPQGTNIIIQPDSLQLHQIVAGIGAVRGQEPIQRFRELGRILATPELTVRSPFLNRTGQHPTFGITDAMYERIPEQILSLLKNDEPRLVVYAYGQALKPAPESVVLAPGSFYQMSTNYQITGEFVSKSVVRITGHPRNPRAIVESYQALPSD